MDSKTTPIQPTPKTSQTGSATKEQSMATQLVLRFMASGQLPTELKLTLQQNMPRQVTIPIPTNLLDQLSQWMKQEAAKQSSQLAKSDASGLTPSPDSKLAEQKLLESKLLEPKLLEPKLPPKIANWLVEALNKQQSQQGLPKLTLSQWLPLIAQMQLTGAASQLNDNPNITSQQQQLIRIIFQLGSTPAERLINSDVHQANKLNTKNDGIAQLLKLLIPIPLQDKASLIMRERAGAASEADAARATAQNQDPQIAARQDNEHIDKHKITERDASSNHNADEVGFTTTLSFTLNFDLDNLGQLTIEFDLTGLQLRSSCVCSNINLLSKVEKHWPELEQRLNQFGFEVDNQVELLPENENRRSRGLIDIKA